MYAPRSRAPTNPVCKGGEDVTERGRKLLTLTCPLNADSALSPQTLSRAYIYCMMGKAHTATGLAIGAGVGLAVFRLKS